MEQKKIIFMGTPPIAQTMLERLVKDGYAIISVVTQPDRKAGRRQEVVMPPVKEYALTQGLPVYQPEDIRCAYEPLLQLDADLIVTCAYGQFIPQILLEKPRFGAINLHASLLPKLRGGAPVHKAIINGDTQSGMSIMRMVRKMDAGAVMAQCRVAIEETDTAGTLFDKLAVAGAELLSESLPHIFDGSAVFVEQNEAEATFAYTIRREEEKIDFSQPLDVVYNHARGLIPFPVGYALHEGKKVKLHRVRRLPAKHDWEAGTCVGMLENGFAVALPGGYLLIDEIQVEGKKKCDARAFFNGAGKQWVHTKLT